MREKILIVLITGVLIFAGVQILSADVQLGSGGGAGIQMSSLKKGLVGYWSFNQDAKDRTPYRNHGIVNGDATLTTDRKANSDKAYRFDGSGDFIESSGIDFGSDSITVSFWAKIETNNGRNYAFDTSNERDPLMKWSDGDTSKIIWGMTNNYITYNQGDRTDDWVYYTFTANGTNEYLYINGSEVDSQSQGESNINFNTLYIAEFNNLGYSMNGKLDEFRIYNRALSQQEIEKLYESYY